MTGKHSSRVENVSCRRNSDRRRFVKCALTGAALGLASIYAFQKLPRVYGYELDIGTLVNPVSLNGVIDDDVEWSDSNDYKMTGVDFLGKLSPLDSAGHLYAKYGPGDSNYTYFALDAVFNTSEKTMRGKSIGDLMTYWNTTDGLYNLIVQNHSGNYVEGESPTNYGTPFKEAFSKGPEGDYDWAHGFASSPNSQTPHTQWEWKIKNSILQRNLTKPTDYFGGSFSCVGSPYIAVYPRDSTFAQVFYQAEPLPEPSDALTVGGLLLSVPIVVHELTKRAKETKGKVTRRQFLKLSRSCQKS
jgi:hypothetical protein